MPMLLIEGTYKIIGAGPDGDSVRFYPHDPDEWDLLRGRRVRRNRSGGAQLRLGFLDYLEQRDDRLFILSAGQVDDQRDVERLAGQIETCDMRLPAHRQAVGGQL
jgi:hypothetical protein